MSARVDRRPRRAEDPAERRKRRPEPVGPVVASLLDELGIAERVDRARAAAEWSRIVGPHIARVTRTARIRGRTLFVEVRSAAWMTELDMMRRDLLERLNAGRERGRIDRIVFLQSGAAGDAGRSPRGRSGESA